MTDFDPELQAILRKKASSFKKEAKFFEDVNQDGVNHINDNNIDEPPVLINGNGSPFVGIEPVTTAIFIAACKAIEAVIPNAKKKPNASGAALQTLIPCHANKANIIIIQVVPINPNSSPIIEKIKSLSLIGKKNNFWRLSPNPKPAIPPEPSAIHDCII